MRKGTNIKAEWRLFRLDLEKLMREHRLGPLGTEGHQDPQPVAMIAANVIEECLHGTRDTCARGFTSLSLRRRAPRAGMAIVPPLGISLTSIVTFLKLICELTTLGLPHPVLLLRDVPSVHVQQGKNVT